MGITTPTRVRNRIQTAEAKISDDVLIEFIADEQAFIESFAGKTFPEADPQFALGRSICTDRCVAKALLFIAAPSAGISYTIEELKVDKISPIPRTPIWRSRNRCGRMRKGNCCCSTLLRGYGPGLRWGHADRLIFQRTAGEEKEASSCSVEKQTATERAYAFSGCR